MRIQPRSLPSLNRLLYTVSVTLIIFLAILLAEGLMILNGISGQRIHALDDAGNLTPGFCELVPLHNLDIVVVLAVGIDYRSREHNPKPFASVRAEDIRSRSDTIILTFINRVDKTVAALSVPRDSLMVIPGKGEDKVNHAFAQGGICLLAKTLENKLDIPIHRFAIVDFPGFSGLIDAIGGVTVHVDEDLKQPGGGAWLPAGEHRLDGEAALRFARHRYGDHRADIGRIERQQHLLMCIARELRFGGYQSIYRVVRQGPDLFKTNLTVPEMFQLYNEFRGIDLDGIDFYSAPGRPVSHYYRLKMDELRPILNKLYPPGG